MKQSDCLPLLASWVDETMLTVTSLSSNAAIWSTVRKGGPSFNGLNMGLCVPFALGLSLAYPRRKVIALDSDGSLMVDTSSLITVADASPPNLIILVLDNEYYARMGPTFTGRRTDLAQMARGAGIQNASTVRTLEEFSTTMQAALEDRGPTFVVAKVERERIRLFGEPRRGYGPRMRELFIDAVLRHPDYPGRKAEAPAAAGDAGSDGSGRDAR